MEKIYYFYVSDPYACPASWNRNKKRRPRLHPIKTVATSEREAILKFYNTLQAARLRKLKPRSNNKKYFQPADKLSDIPAHFHRYIKYIESKPYQPINQHIGHALECAKPLSYFFEIKKIQPWMLN